MKWISRTVLCLCVCATGLGCGSNGNDPVVTLAEAIKVLEQGKFTGNITFSSDGRISVSESVHFGIGPTKTLISVDGHVDFKEPLLRETSNFPNTDGAGGGTGTKDE